MATHPDTRTVHPPAPPATGSTPVGVPLHQSHVFSFDTADQMAAAFQDPDGAFLYSRFGNPTVRTLEQAISDLEGGTGGLAFASGMGAITGVLRSLVSSGDHVIAQRSLYGGTYATFEDLAARWGVTVTYVSGTDPEEVRAALTPRTRVLYLETIANPTTAVSDLPALFAVAAEAGVTGIVDNTFATPLLCRPLEHGADIVIHSATKYLGGHADILGGAAVFRDTALRRRVWEHVVEEGATLDPFAAWLTLRGMSTLALRVHRQSTTAQLLAERLAAHPAVTRVHYAGLPDHPSYERAQRLLSGGAGGVLSFDIAGGREAGRTFIESVQLALLSPSLGDVKTLVMHPASTSHRQLDRTALAAMDIAEGTIRIAVGIEHPDDLWSDIEQALAKAAA
ncbi:aminotransferase class I/II-fold pyridoxal phosphate-dependent enzyme [Streptomyces sp. A7024]|uniref:homocysteine desulfhydrase n=1 Tax=Streptomyces coryli TaxID=1128680 RepID=A0A6G4U0H5_9ACTN|nr:aminotransferase class I/II-fold pyridoxal phosphate-dependent enzyme [Streptomyces coryli]NGN65769.1 aminotransferase class I/II-fold pyridoxal phosphate-dependent enzyme [Streptomyces coryli]